MSSARKLTFSLSSGTADNLNAITQRLGVSRSGFVESILSSACGDMVKVLDTLPTPPENGTKTDLVRLRGASVDVLQSRIADLKEQVDEM